MRSTGPKAVSSSVPGGMVYQAILLVCASVALGFTADALVAAADLVPDSVAWTSMGQALVSTLILSVSCSQP